MTKPISGYDASELSDAGYIPLDDWIAGHRPNGDPLPDLPEGWHRHGVGPS
jgi:hypothetical protein